MLATKDSRGAHEAHMQQTTATAFSTFDDQQNMSMQGRRR